MGAESNSTTLRRLFRRVWPVANPLRRRTDLFEPLALLCVVLAFALSIVLAIGTWNSVLNDRTAQIRHEEMSRHQVQATVVSDPGTGTSTGAPHETSSRPVAVRWGQPPQERFAVIELPDTASHAGAVPIWLDNEGRLTSAPTGHDEAVQAAGTASAAVILGMIAGIGTLYGAARYWVTRRRLAAWAAEWEKVGPQWRKYVL